jgi:CTP:molybdopterin cytidylyltransferase MocA
MDTAPDLSGLILAAGQGRRMGGLAKGALRLDGEPIVRRQIHALRALGVSDIVVVLGAHAETLAPLIADLPVRTVRHATEAPEITDSQRLGLAALRPDTQGVMVILSDLVLLEASDLQEALRQWTARPPSVQCLFPVVAGQRGHPTLLSRIAVQAILAQADALGVRDWQRTAQDQVMRFASANAHFTTDVDTLEALAQVDRDLGGGRLQPPD